MILPKFKTFFFWDVMSPKNRRKLGTQIYLWLKVAPETERVWAVCGEKVVCGVEKCECNVVIKITHATNLLYIHKNDFYNNCSFCYKTPWRLLCVPCGASSVLTAAAVVCCVSYFTKKYIQEIWEGKICDVIVVVICPLSLSLLFHDKVLNKVRERWKHLSLLVFLLFRHVMMRNVLLWFLSLCLPKYIHANISVSVLGWW